MKIIYSNDFYEIGVDSARNLLYFTGKGKWVRRSDVERAPDHLREASRYLTPGCKVLSNVQGVEVTLLPDVVMSIQKVVADLRPDKVAAVWSQQVLAAMQLDRTAEKAGAEYANARRSFSEPRNGFSENRRLLCNSFELSSSAWFRANAGPRVLKWKTA